MVENKSLNVIYKLSTGDGCRRRGMSGKVLQRVGGYRGGGRCGWLSGRIDGLAGGWVAK